MNTIVETINAAGRAFVGFSLPMLIQSSVLIVILLAVDAVLRRKVRAVFRYWIWLLVLVKLVLPPSLGSPVSVGTWFGDKLEVPTMLPFEPEPPSAEPSPLVSAILSAPDPMFRPLLLSPPQAAGPAAPLPTVEASAPVQAPMVSLSWQGLTLLAWAAVAIALTLLLVQRAFFVRGLVGQAQEANRALLDALEDCRSRLGLRRRIGLRLSPNASSPAVCGLLHPTILVPQSLAPRLHSHDLHAVLLHELAHVKRGDLWVNLAQTLLQIAYFYNPLLWLANAMIRRAREQAVDETVLVAMGETAKQYPEILVNIAKLAFRRRPALSLRLIGVVESKSALTGRIKHILSRPLPRTAKLGMLGLLVVLLFAAVLLPMAKARPFGERADGTDNSASEEPNELSHASAAALPDSDGDGLIDFQEVHKYLTDPAKADSDGDGTPDGDWNERREYAYSVRTVLRYMPPFDEDGLNDDFQDARVLTQTGEYVEVEVVHYPLATSHEEVPENRNWRRDYAHMTEFLASDVTTNWDGAMRRDLLAALKADGIDVETLSDKQVVEQVSSWLMKRSRSLDKVFTTYYVHFPQGKPEVYPGLEDAFRREFERDSGSYDWTLAQHFDHELLGKGMFYNRTHGSCTSTAIYMTTVLRALRIPTRMVLATPVVDASDREQILMVKKALTHNKVRETVLAGLRRSSSGFTNHTFNEVYVGGRWQRLDYTRLGCPAFGVDRFGLQTRLYTILDLSDVDFASTWGRRYAKGERTDLFKHSNPYTAVEVSELFGPHGNIPNPPFSTQDFSSSPLPDVFLFNPVTVQVWEDFLERVSASTFNKTGRPHAKEYYDNIFEGVWATKPGDILVLLFSLDTSERIPQGYEDLLPRPWSQIESELAQGRTVELAGKAREMNVILLAAPTIDGLKPLVQSSNLLGALGKPADSSGAPAGSVTVELLGVCEYPSEGRQWWRPDGSPMKRAPYKTTGSEREQEAGFKDYELVVRYTGAPDMSIDWDVPGSRNSGITGSPLGEDDRRIWDLTVNTVRFPADQASATVRVAAAAGPWQTRAVHKTLDREGAYSLDAGKAVTFGIAHVQGDNTLVPVTVNLSRHDMAFRVVAVLSRDEICEGGLSGFGGDELSSMTYRFHCPLSDVKEFRFQTRTWTWFEFEDVSLRPGQKADDGSAARARARVLGIGPAWEALRDAVGTRYRGTIGGFGREERRSAEYLDKALSWTKAGDAFVLMLAFDEAPVVPEQYRDLLLMPWSEIESRVQRGESVEARGAARGLDVIVLAAATSEQLNALVRKTPLLDAYRVEASKEITLPDVDQQAVMLDLATGQLVPTPQVEPPERLLETIKELGKGDLVLDHQSLILVRGATSPQAAPGPEDLVRIITIGSALPRTVTVTTAEGRQYEIRVLSIDDKACRVTYSPMPVDAVEMRAAGAGSAEREETIVLPEADHRPVVLDLATGELVPLPAEGPEPRKIQQALRKLGKGDILYDVDLGDRSLILLRGAVSEQVQEDTGESGVKGHFVGDNLPEVLTVTTAEGGEYRIEILGADDEACTLSYSPISTAGGDSGGAPGKSATEEAKSSDSGLIARLANGVTITLLAYSRLSETGLEWWTPQGERTTIPGVYEADVEGHGTVLALRAKPTPEVGVFAWLCQPPDVKKELKPVWRVGDSDVWLVPLGEGRKYVNVEIMAQVRDPVVVKAVARKGLSLPGGFEVDQRDISWISDVNRIDSDWTAFSAPAGSDGPAVVAALDVSGQVHSLRRVRKGDLQPIYGPELSGRRRCETNIPQDRFAGIVVEGYRERAALMKLGNLSLRPGQPTQVRVEVEPEQRGPWWHRSEYDSRLDDLGRCLAGHAETHGGSYPADESTLHTLCHDELWQWLQGHVVYLGAGKTSTVPAGTVLAYVKTLLPFGFGTYVLHADGNVEFVVPSKLKELGIPEGGQSGRVGGPLEFRIAANRANLDPATVERYQQALVNGNGSPEADFAWFPTRAGITGFPQVPAQEHGGTTYVLLRNKPPHVILASQDWGLDKVYRITEANGRPAIGLTLNDKGASLFHSITAANVGRPLAILIHGEVVSIPSIMSPLGRSAMIAGNFTEREVADMMAALRKGMEATRPPAEPGETTDAGEETPFSIHGTVTDQSGRPMASVEIAASCGVGTGLPTGRTVTDEAGRYTLYFKPGFVGHEVLLQAATISARKPSFYEANLYRQGNLAMTGKPPRPEDVAHYAGVVLPDQPYELNFVMHPAARIEGELVDERGKPLSGQTLWLNANERYPSTSVLATIQTDETGRFTVETVPLEAMWFEGPRPSRVHSDSIDLTTPGTWQVKLGYRSDAEKLTIIRAQPPVAARSDVALTLGGDDPLGLFYNEHGLWFELDNHGSDSVEINPHPLDQDENRRGEWGYVEVLAEDGKAVTYKWRESPPSVHKIPPGKRYKVQDFLNGMPLRESGPGVYKVRLTLRVRNVRTDVAALVASNWHVFRVTPAGRWPDRVRGPYVELREAEAFAATCNYGHGSHDEAIQRLLALAEKYTGTKYALEAYFTAADQADIVSNESGDLAYQAKRREYHREIVKRWPDVVNHYTIYARLHTHFGIPESEFIQSRRETYRWLLSITEEQKIASIRAYGAFTVQPSDENLRQNLLSLNRYISQTKQILETSIPDIATQASVAETRSQDKNSASGGISGRVVDPNGQPVAGAQVALCTEDQGVTIAPPALRPTDFQGKTSAIVETDAQGRFSFPAVSGEFVLFAACETGFVQVESRDLSSAPSLRLQRWGRVEGTLYVGSKPGADETVKVLVDLGGGAVPWPWVRYEQESRAQDGGRFRFPCVAPVWARLAHYAWMPDGRRESERGSISQAGSTNERPICVKAGETLRVTIGGTGRPVVGRLILPAGQNRGNGQTWAMRMLATVAPDIPRPAGYEQMSPAERSRWLGTCDRTPAGRAYRLTVLHDLTRRSYYFPIDANDSFRIEDVIPGRYALRVWLWETPETPGPSTLVGPFVAGVELPPMAEAYTEEPLDLGSVKLEMYEGADIGFAWQRTDRYVSPDPDGFFPDDPEGGKKLDVLFQAVDKDARSDDEILSTVRQGFRRTTQHRTLILSWIGNRYIWGKDPQNAQAIEIMYHAAPLEQHYAVYFGLSVTRDKTPNILRTLADICMRGEEVGRITWGLGDQRDAMLAYITPHLQDSDPDKRQTAELLVKHFKGELDFEQWQREKRDEQARARLGDQLPQIRQTLLTGDSEARRQAFVTLARSGGSVLDDSFLPALQAAASDPSSEVRNDVVRTVGGRWIWSAQQQDPTAIALALRLSSDSDREVRYNAVYYGLSTVRDKSEAVVRRLVEMALAEHENNLYGRIVWGLKGPMRAAPALFTQALAEHLDRAKSDVYYAASVYQLHRDVLGTEPPADWGLARVRDRYPDDLFVIPFSAREPFTPADVDALWAEFSAALPAGVTAERLTGWYDSRATVCRAKIRGKERAEAVRTAIENHPRLRAGEITPLTVPMQLFLEERGEPARPRAQVASPRPRAESRAQTPTGPGPIQQKIDAAAPGDTVRLEAGTYHERLRIDKPLTLEGAGWDKTTVTMESRMPESKEQAADLAALSVLSVVGTRDVMIRGIKFTAPGRRVEGRSLPMAVVSLNRCGAWLTDCAVIGGPGDGIHVLDQSNVAMQRCLVAAVWGTGVRVGSPKDVSEASIADSDIRNCHYAGIRIAKGNQATIERCRVSGAAWHGIRYDDASPVISGNLIFASARSGIYASGQTAATIKGNLFWANEMCGMSCWFQDNDRIEGNTFAQNKRSGLEIIGVSKPDVRGNIFYASPAGISLGDVADDSPFAKSDGAAPLENNVFWSNEQAIRRGGGAVIAQAAALDEKAGVSIDPRFAAPDARDFSLKADSPARLKGIGAADPIPFAGPWPLQPEESAIIPRGDTRDSRQWRDPPVP